MNKLEGFLELEKMGIPSIRWKEYKTGVILDNSRLWTVRVAIPHGDDLNLPRLVGVSGLEAARFAEKMARTLNVGSLIIYYPYFVALKSGILEINFDGYIIETVEKDLWNLTTKGKSKQILIFKNETLIEVFGDKDFLTQSEIDQLMVAGRKVRGRLRHLIAEGKSILLEWSFAKDSDVYGFEIGEPYLIFYEIRCVKQHKFLID